jgi:hypothetical protein
VDLSDLTCAGRSFEAVGLGSEYQSEGVAGYVFASQQPGTAPLYRMWNEDDHFYTTNEAERDDAAAYGYAYEGITGYVYVDPPQVERRAIYRYYNNYIRDHLDTADPSAEWFGDPPRWTYGGINYYLAAHEVPGAVPLYRCWRGEDRPSDDHMSTTSPDCESGQGYVLETTLGWIFTSQVDGTVPLYRCYDTRDNWNDHMSTTSPDCEGGATWWNIEGPLGYVYVTPGDEVADRLAFYRLYNRRINDHFYTTNLTGEAVTARHYIFEATAGFLPVEGTPGTVPLYRYWNGVIGDHFYTTSPTGELIFDW